MCPVLLPTGMAQIWVLAEYVDDDQVTALELAVSQLGVTLAVPQRRVISAASLTEINRQNRSKSKGTVLAEKVSTTPRHALMALLDDLIAWALKHDASDIHLTINDTKDLADIAYTMNGSCQRPAAFAQLSRQMVQELLAVTWMTVQAGNGAVLDVTREQQGRFERSIAGHRTAVRWASIVLQSGLSVCWRLLTRAGWRVIPSLEALGYDPQERRQLMSCLRPSGGLVVFAGLVGSGKSTSLACLMKMIPESRKVMTLEDPVEYEIPNALQCAVNGFDANDANSPLSSKLKAIKRSAAHDVLIGELRDTSGGLAVSDLVTAGVNVYTTVHASSALAIFSRLASASIAIPESLLLMPGFVKLLVYQCLVSRLCESCALSAEHWVERVECPSNVESLQLSPEARRHWLSRVSEALGMPHRSWRFRNRSGCKVCLSENSEAQAGYNGRQLVTEMVAPHVMPDLYRHLLAGDMRRQMASWQWDWQSQAGGLDRFVSVQTRAAALVSAGQLDVSDFLARFVPDWDLALDGEVTI